MGIAQQIESLWGGLTNNSGQPLAAGKVYTYAPGTTTPKATYTANDKSSSATNPIILDAYGRAQIWADGKYKLVVKDSTDTTLYTLDNQVYGYDQGEIIWGATSGGTANAQTISVSGSITSYVAGQRYSFIAGASNTGAMTLNANSIGNVSVVKGEAASALTLGDVRSGDIIDVEYETGGGGRFRLLSAPSIYQIQTGQMLYGGTSTGSANAQVIALNPGLTTPTAGTTVVFIAGFTNTGATTLSTGGSAYNVFWKGRALAGGEIGINVVHKASFDGTRYHLLNHGGVWMSYTPTVNAVSPMSASRDSSTCAYLADGSSIYIRGSIGFTTSGSASDSVTMAPPVGTIAAPYYVPCVCYDGGYVGGFILDQPTNLFRFLKDTGAVWTIAAGKQVYFNGVYQIS